MDWAEEISRDMWARPLRLPEEPKECARNSWWERVLRWWRRGYYELKSM